MGCYNLFVALECVTPTVTLQIGRVAQLAEQLTLNQ